MILAHDRSCIYHSCLFTGRNNSMHSCQSGVVHSALHTDAEPFLLNNKGMQTAQGAPLMHGSKACS